MSKVISPDQLYRKVENTLYKGSDHAWILAVFEGSPTGTEYSWCSDCVAASADLRSFITEYRGIVKVVQFKVGSKREWEGLNGGPSPFKAKFPFLSDLPTAVLFRGRQDVARTIAPRKYDLLYLSRRAEVLEGQIEDGSWVPPSLT